MSIILGLDVSTSITAICLMDENGKILESEAYRLEKEEDVFKKASVVEAGLKNIKSKYNVTNVFIESPVMVFQSGASSAFTIAKLQCFNGMVSLLAYQLFNVVPEYLTPAEARKCCNIKMDKSLITKNYKVKNYVFDTFSAGYDGFKYALTKQNNPVPGTLDRSDALVIAFAGNKKINGEPP